jgi:diphosphomevalonate decarboxylase
MNLGALITRTTVIFDAALSSDGLQINHTSITGEMLMRVSRFLDIVRERADRQLPASVISDSNYPIGAGIASSAAAFAALAAASSRALGLELSEADLSALARRGSGSASRSVPDGFVEWLPGSSDTDSYSVSIAPPEHWQLMDFIAILEETPKKVGSSQGHLSAATSLLQSSRVSDASRRIEFCKQAILMKDMDALATAIELDSNWLHAIMLTSFPPLNYLKAGSFTLMKLVIEARRHGLPICYTVDAGANVHVIGESTSAETIEAMLRANPHVRNVVTSGPGEGVKIVNDSSS